MYIPAGQLQFPMSRLWRRVISSVCVFNFWNNTWIYWKNMLINALRELRAGAYSWASAHDKTILRKHSENIAKLIHDVLYSAPVPCHWIGWCRRWSYLAAHWAWSTSLEVTVNSTQPKLTSRQHPTKGNSYITYSSPFIRSDYSQSLHDSLNCHMFAESQPHHCADVVHNNNATTLSKATDIKSSLVFQVFQLLLTAS